MQDFPKLCSHLVQFFEITICLARSPPLLAVSLLVGRPRLVGREEEGKASKFSPAGRRVAQPSPSPVEPAGRGGKGAPRPMKPNVEWTNATRSRSASAPRYPALSLKQARDNDAQVGKMPSVQSAEFGRIREISDVGWGRVAGVTYQTSGLDLRLRFIARVSGVTKIAPHTLIRVVDSAAARSSTTILPAHRRNRSCSVPR